jgi:hypothetical protein
MLALDSLPVDVIVSTTFRLGKIVFKGQVQLLFILQKMSLV